MRRGFSCPSQRGLGQRGETGGPSRAGRSHIGTSVPTASMARGGSWGLSKAQSQQRWQCEVPRKETEVESSRRWGNHRRTPNQAQSYVFLVVVRESLQFHRSLKKGEQDISYVSLSVGGTSSSATSPLPTFLPEGLLPPWSEWCEVAWYTFVNSTHHAITSRIIISHKVLRKPSSRLSPGRAAESRPLPGPSSYV